MQDHKCLEWRSTKSDLPTPGMPTRFRVFGESYVRIGWWSGQPGKWLECTSSLAVADAMVTAVQWWMPIDIWERSI